MTNPNQTDSFFFTKYNQTDNPAVKSVQTMSLSLNKRVSNRRVELDDMYNNYNLFK